MLGHYDLLESVPATVEYDRSTLRLDMARIHNRLRPFVRLPDEIILHILEIGEQPHGSPRPWRSRVLPAHVAEYNRRLVTWSAVCQRFRSLFLSSPRCWSHIPITIDNEWPSTSSAKLLTYLERSVDCPLHLYLSLYSDDDVDARDMVEGSSIIPDHGLILLDIIRPHMPKCRAMTLQTNISGLKMALLMQEHIFAPAMEHFAFQSYWGEGYAIDNTLLHIPFINGSQAPVKSLSIWEPMWLEFRWVEQLLRVDLGSLARFRIRGVLTQPAVGRLIQQCPNLEHLHWDLGLIPLDPDDIARIGVQPTEIYFQKLISMNLAHNDPDNDAPIFHAPSLRQLVLDYGSIPLQDRSVFRANQPPFPMLKRFEFCPFGVGPTQISEFLRRHPTLEEIALTLPRTSPVKTEHLCEVIDCLTAPVSDPETKPHFLPMLQKLWLETRNENFDDENGMALARAVHRLLSKRPGFSVNIFVIPEDEESPHDNEHVIHAYKASNILAGEVVYYLSSYILVDWPNSWDPEWLRSI